MLIPQRATFSQLFAEDDGYREPIARFLRARKAEPMRPAQLVLTARGEEILDIVVISFLFLEKSRRTNETSSQNCVDAWSTPPLSGINSNDYNVRDGGIGV